MALPPLELPPIEKGRPVAGRPFCVVDNVGRNFGKRCVWRVLSACEGQEWIENFADGVIADRMTKEFADVAQLVEQLIRNQQVNGSSPFVGSSKFNLHSTEIVSECKSVT